MNVDWSFAKLSVVFLVLGLCGLMVSCSPWRDNYFDDGIGELTQTDVKGKLGKPHIVDDPLLSQETTWMYRYVLSESDLDPWGFKTFGKEAGSLLSGPEEILKDKVYCYVYTLVFDEDTVLRDWRREKCKVPTPPNPFEQGLSG